MYELDEQDWNDNRTPCILGEWLVSQQEMFLYSGMYSHGGWAEYFDQDEAQTTCDDIIREMVYGVV